MKLRNIEIIGAVLAAIVIAVIIALTKSVPVLFSARFPLLLIAGGLYSASLFFWSAVWVFLVGLADASPVGQASEVSRSSIGQPHRVAATQPHRVASTICATGQARHSRYGGTFAISIASLIGILTPMNIGTDFLRSFYGKKHLGLELNLTATASILAREFKLHVTLLLVMFLAITPASVQDNFIKTLIIPTASVLFLLVILYSLRANFAGRLAKRLKIGNISKAIRQLSLKLGLVKRCLIYSVFATGFVLEWLSLHLCFLALNLKPTLSATFVFFVLLYFLSRTPFIPQGLGVVEVSGFALLKTMECSTAQMGALLVIWDLLRIFIPILLSIVFSFNLIAMKKRHTE